ncbi:MAG: hypothetical protein ACTSVT_03070 [Candidatus Thorarchaeota archaeon]
MAVEDPQVQESADEQSESSEVDSGPRIGVFPCMCGKNITGVVDIEAVAEYAKTLPGVVFVQVNRYTCADTGQREIQEAIREPRLGHTSRRCGQAVRPPFCNADVIQSRYWQPE